MSFQAMTWAVEKELPALQKLVLLMLANHCNNHTGQCNPSMKRLAKECGMSRDSIIRSISEMEANGILKIVRQTANGVNLPNQYELNIKGVVADSEEGGLLAGGGSSQLPRVVADSEEGVVADSNTKQEIYNQEVKPTTENSAIAEDNQQKTPICPVKEIIELYHQFLPSNPKCKVLHEKRKCSIKARWEQASQLTCKPFGYKTRSAGLAAWAEFFKTCAESAFLTGNAPPQKDRLPFIADIDFLLSPSGFTKCLENKYHREIA